MILGSAWYPEQWRPARWSDDLRLMQAANFNLVRVGEFAWSRMEPQEGAFDLDWLEQAIELAVAHGMAVVVGTPTAAPPAWLTQRYPEVLAVRADGRRETHGKRCHFNPASPRYLAFCRRISEMLAQRFGTNPHVIGWQIDNEYNTVSYDDETRQQFQHWLHTRYTTLDQLNERWAAAYWSQEYSDWTQIPLPIGGGHHPALQLDFRRFVTAVYHTYQHEQLVAIRTHAEPRQWITHNFMSWFDGFDHYALSEELDLVSWDNYVGSGRLNYLANGAAHDLVRGFKRKNFWLMETQPGSVNWTPVNNMLDRGEVRTMAWHAVGHGADAICYWQWRSAPGGQEQYHGSLLGADGQPRPLYAEVAELGREFAVVAEALRDSEVRAQIALLHSYDDRWAIDQQRHHRDFDPVQHLLAYYQPLRARGYDIDIVHPQADLSRYKLVLAPQLHLLDEALSTQLARYVESGGHLLLGARSGMKDASNALLPMLQPGPLAELLGARVREFYALDVAVPVAGNWGVGTAQIWAEWLEPLAEDVEVLLRYGTSNGWLDGQAAAVSRRVGAGRISYIGAWLDAATLDGAADWMLSFSELDAPPFGLPAGVELSSRSKNGRTLYLLINHGASAQTLAVPAAARELLRDEAFASQLTLAPRDVALIEVS
jgi:beta-galactosidase